MKKYKNISIALMLAVFVLAFSFKTAHGAWFSFKGKVKLGSTTLLSNMWNGTCSNAGYCPLGTEFPGGSQIAGGVDDYNNGGAPASGRYSGSWTQCTSSNSYCSTATSSAAWKDNSTGLIWSKALSTSGGLTDIATSSVNWYVANNCQESGSPYTCTKKTSSKTGCEANTGWFVPTQKQLMQVYIDGAYGKLDSAGANRIYWSATTKSYNTSIAWSIYLSYGYTTYSDGKTNANYVRCVRES